MTLQVLINGVDKTSALVQKSLKINDQVNSKVDTLSFLIRKYGTTKTYKPVAGDEVVVNKTENSITTTIFGGVIITIKEEMESELVLLYDIQAIDYSQYLNRSLILDRFTSMSAGDIITSLVAEYAPTFTTANVNANVNIASISFNRVTLTEAIDKLAKLLNYSWYVDYNKDVHFFPKNTEVAPFTITDTSTDYIHDSLIISSDISQIRNRVTITGGEAPSNPRTVTADADGVKKQWPTVFKFQNEPVVTVSGVPKTVGLEGIDSEDDFDFLWNYNGQYIRSKTAWAGGANAIAMTGIPLLPIVVQISDAASIGQYGVYEYAKENKSIRTQQEAIDFAFAELDAYADTIKEGEFSTYTSGLRSGQVITINSALRGVNEQFIIQKVTMQQVSLNTVIYKVVIATLRTVGIIDVLQGLLRKEEIKEGESEGLLTFMPLADSATASDSLNSIASQTGPYTWSGPSGSTEAKPMIWGSFTWG